jgi:hypothetical protein
VHHSLPVQLNQCDAFCIQFIENQGPLHFSSITCSSSGGATRIALGIVRAYNVSWLWHACIFTAPQPMPPEDEQVMLETCRGPWFSINWMKSVSRWFHYTDAPLLLLLKSRRYNSLTLSLQTSYVYGAPFKAKHFKIVYIWTYVWQRWKPSLSIFCTMFQHWINAESYPVAQLSVNSLLATKATLITHGI